MALYDRLRDRSAAILQRWVRDTLATYPEDSRALFDREKDPFANPVGHALRTATGAVMEAVLRGDEPAAIGACLSDLIKIRVVQEFSPSQAVAFVFLLKQSIRAELPPEETRDPGFSVEFAELERRIDEVALGAFDIYLHYRQQVYELRMNEVKRSVGVYAERMGRRGFPETSDADLVQLGARLSGETERGDAE